MFQANYVVASFSNANDLQTYTIPFHVVMFLTNFSMMAGFISGSEAMFADLCYFSVRSVQVKQLMSYVLSTIHLKPVVFLVHFYSLVL